MAYIDIGGGKAQKTTIFVAMLDNALDGEGSRQQGRGSCAIAIL